jgi:hypothetical protein
LGAELHSFTAQDVLKPDFDLSLLKFSEEYISDFVQRYEREKEAMVAELKKENRHHNPHWSSIVLKIISNDIPDNFTLSCIFDDTFILKLRELTGDNYSESFFDYYVQNICKQNRSLGDKVALHSKVEHFKGMVLWRGLVSNSTVEKMIKSEFILKTFPYFQENIVTLYGSEEAKVFVKSEYEAVRLAAYKKLGPIRHIDAMLADKSAKIRLYTVQIMDFGDERLSLLINDSSKRVFAEVLEKISEKDLPLLIGNRFLKDKYIKKRFESRFELAKK